MWNVGRRALASWTFVLGFAGCATTITVEDDDGAGNGDDGAGNDGAGGDEGLPAGAGAAGSTSGSAAGEAAVEEARSACFDYYYSCNGNASALLTEYGTCVELSPLPECAPLLTELYRCATVPGGNQYGSCDEELESECSALHSGPYQRCMNPNGCSPTEEDPGCMSPDDEGNCSCDAPCRDGHTARIECRSTSETRGDTCDCYFDGVLTGQCTNPPAAPSGSCWPRTSCCLSMLR